MSKRAKILIGMGLGALWGVGLIWIGTTQVALPIFTYTWTLALAFMFPGLALAAMIARLAQRRFFDDGLIDGAPPLGNSGADIDTRVLQNTLEQLALALALWPATGFILAVKGPGVVLMLGIGFAVARIAFWVGYHVSPALRAFGFAATFYPTLLALGWAGLWWFVN